MKVPLQRECDVICRSFMGACNVLRRWDQGPLGDFFEGGEAMNVEKVGGFQPLPSTMNSDVWPDTEQGVRCRVEGVGSRE